MVLSCLPVHAAYAISSLDLQEFSQLFLFFCLLISTVNLDGLDTAADVLGDDGVVVLANSCSFTVLLFDTYPLKHWLMYAQLKHLLMFAQLKHLLMFTQLKHLLLFAGA